MSQPQSDHPTVVVTGAAGQDGIYLSRLLASQGARVVGTVRPGWTDADPRAGYLADVEVVPLDLLDGAGFAELVRRVRPQQVFNLAGFTSVGASWGEPDLVEQVNAVAVEQMLDAVTQYREDTSIDVTFVQASSAEELGEAPDSPYARSKSRARAAVDAARRDHGLRACSAILHNHESPLRPSRFVTRKITQAAAEISLGRRDRLSLGNLEVVRDWGSAQEYAELLRGLPDRLAAQEYPGDVVISTGVTHSLTGLIDVAFGAVGLSDPMQYVDHDPALLRPADAQDLSPAADRLVATSIRATRVSFADVITHMAQVDLTRLRTGVEHSVDYLQPLIIR